MTVGTVREKQVCQHQCGQELGSSSRVNTCEHLINAVIANKPKMLTGLDQKVCSQDTELRSLCAMAEALPANRVNLTYSGIEAEHGKPATFPVGKANRKVSR